MVTSNKKNTVIPKDEPTTVTINGLTLTISPSVFDDLEILELLEQLAPADGTEPNGLAIIPLLKRIFGTQYKDVKTALRDKTTGVITIDAVQSFITDFMRVAFPNS